MFPEPFTVKVETKQSGALDDWGDPIESWAPAAEVPVYGWAPAGADELRDLATGERYDCDIYSATRFCSKGDRVELPGRTGKFLVVAEPDDFNFGPFAFRPGYRVRVKQTEG